MVANSETYAASLRSLGGLGQVRYYPYGETRSGTLPTAYQFTGQRFEAGLGLYDYHARYYDPTLGRFISADTLVPNPGDPQSLNRYAYVQNNPLVYVDPSGHYLEMGNGLGLREVDDGTYRVLHGGSVFVNYAEVDLANYELSGGQTALPEAGGAFAPTIRGSINNARAGLGHTDGGSGAWSLLSDPMVVFGLSWAMVKSARRETVPSEDLAYRYVSEGEAAVIRRTGRIPNVDRWGNPKPVFTTPNRYDTIAAAEEALQIGRLNPSGPTASPTYRAEYIRTAVRYYYAGNVEGGAGIEMLTESSIPIVRLIPLWR